MSWQRWALAEKSAIIAADRWRTIRELDTSGPVVRADGAEVVSFASNDYFGLSRHPAVRTAAHEAIERWGTGAGSARLIAGARPVHSELERELASWKGTEPATSGTWPGCSRTRTMRSWSPTRCFPWTATSRPSLS